MNNLEYLKQVVDTICMKENPPCGYIFRRPGFIERVEGKVPMKLVEIQPLPEEQVRRPGIIERVDAAMKKDTLQDNIKSD